MLAGELRPNQVPERSWQHILVDFIMKLPISKGYNSILVVCDRFSKISHFVVTTEKTTVEGLVRLFRDNVWKLHRLPKSVISDRGPQFAAGLTRELNKMLGIETKLSMAYHPQTDRQTERTNQELKQYLRMYVNHRQNNWSEWLAIAEFTFNNKVHTATKMLPFQVNYGRELRIGFDIRKKGKNEKVEEFVKEMKERYEEARCHMQVHPSGNNIPTVKSSPKHTSSPSTAATFLTTHLMVVLQPFGYSVFHGRDTPIQLSLL